jgi:hypothetical protein
VQEAQRAALVPPGPAQPVVDVVVDRHPASRFDHGLTEVGAPTHDNRAARSDAERNMQDRPLRESTGWTLATIVMDVPENARSLSLDF